MLVRIPLTASSTDWLGAAGCDEGTQGVEDKAVPQPPGRPHLGREISQIDHHCRELVGEGFPVIQGR